ncbi:MAG: hypothetical protein ABIJ61_12185, partial [bacterium]
MAKCLICRRDATYDQSRDVDPDPLIANCKYCGQYTAFKAVKDLIYRLAETSRLKLSGFCIERTLLGAPVTFSTEENVQSAVEAAPTDILEKFDRLLLNLARRTSYLGQLIELDTEHEYSLGYCGSGSELLGQLNQLRQQGYIESNPNLTMRSVIMSVPGFKRASELRAARRAVS